MFGILAKAFNIATRTDHRWNAPPNWIDHDHRTRAQKERDAQQQRRMLRQTGIL
jgi:hypothetical protein